MRSSAAFNPIKALALSLLAIFFLLFLTTTTTALPTTTSTPPYSSSSSISNPLTKRHPYTLICRTRDSFGTQQDDIPLSRRCTKAPHHYRCDFEGNPDVGNGGRTDEECDRKCECRDVSTDPKPRCVALGGGMGGWHVCDVGSGL